METVVYVDTLFIINFIMDGLCLLICSVWLSKRPHTIRLTAASVLGGLYSVAVMSLPVLHPLLTVAVHFAAAFVICLTATKWEGLKKLTKHVFCFFFACAVMGGIMYAVFSLCGSFAMYGGAFYGEPTGAAVIICGVIATSALVYCMSRLRSKSKALYCDLIIEYRGKTCVASCITDSGNLLTCPFTALPVAIINTRTAKKLFSEEELELLIHTPVMEGIRPMPINGVGGALMLPSFVPEKIKIRTFGEKDFTEKRLCIALQLKGKDFGGQDGIVPTAVL